MRTTLTLDDELATKLKRVAAESRRPFKKVVNDTLRAGLEGRARRAATPYRLRPSSLGLPHPGVRLDKALQLADEMEDGALMDKLEQRK